MFEYYIVLVIVALLVMVVHVVTKDQVCNECGEKECTCLVDEQAMG